MENNNIYKPNEDFNFDQFTLCSPNSLQNNSYFTKILINNSSLYIETPKSISKQGFIINGKKMYCDLMFDNNDKEFIHWIELLELKCHKLIYEKSESWFENKLLLDDIESVFSSPLKIYKAGKNYLLRVNIKMNYTTNLPSIKIYNENETSVSFDEINANTTMISILEVQGIKFTSKNFQIEFELKQIMVLDVDKIFEKCLIKTNVLNKLTASLEEKEMPVIKEIIKEKEIQEPTETDHLKIYEKNKELEEDLEEDLENTLEEENQENTLENQLVLDNTLEEENQENTLEKQLVLENTLEEIKENPLDMLEEVNINTNNLEIIKIKKPNQVFYEIYKTARNKAKKTKKEAIVAFLEAKNIKKIYMLEDLDESEEEDDLLNFE